MAEPTSQNSITAAAFFESERLTKDASLSGAELAKAFWRIRGMLKEQARQERFWASTNQALDQANRDLEQRSRELREARAALLTLNHELERRVAEQVEEILSRSQQVEALNTQLQIKVQERSRELSMALSQLARHTQPVLKEGDVLGARVRIVRLIGRGGMGRVYLGDDLLTGQQVAVKLLLPEAVCGHEELQRFIDEAQYAATVSHPGIVRTLHVDVTDEGTPYQIMEYIRGAPLAKRIGQGPIAAGPAARLVAAVADALMAAHAQGVVHRDRSHKHKICFLSSHMALHLRRTDEAFLPLPHCPY